MLFPYPWALEISWYRHAPINSRGELFSFSFSITSGKKPGRLGGSWYFGAGAVDITRRNVPDEMKEGDPRWFKREKARIGATLDKL